MEFFVPSLLSAPFLHFSFLSVGQQLFRARHYIGLKGCSQPRSIYWSNFQPYIQLGHATEGVMLGKEQGLWM